MAKAKGRSRQERGLVDKTEEPDPEERFVPSRPASGDQCRTYDVGSHQVFHGVWFGEDGRVTDFCMCIQVPIEGEWNDVLRIDCCHGEVHVHRFDSGGRETRKVLFPVYSQEDVEKGFDQATRLIYEQADVALMGWERGL